MRIFRQPLYAQIAALFMFLVLAFCAIVVALTARQFDALLVEIGQRLNRDLAGHLVERLGADLDTGLQSERAMRAVQRVRDINPALDIYVLDETGRVDGAYAGTLPPPGTRVDLTPIHAFLARDAMLPIRAVDPANPGEMKVFSAASMTPTEADPAFLYIILHGSPLDTAASMLRNSYIVRGVAFTFALLLISMIAVGLVLFSLLTRRFRRQTDTVLSISNGNYDRRIAVVADDEIGQLGHAVNEMAGMIQTQVEELRRTDEARRDLVANLSHDFRTPPTSLRGYARRLDTGWDRLDSTERRECLEAMSSTTEQLEHFASQLASLSIIDGHGQSVQMESFSLNELVQDVILKFRPMAARRQVSLDGHHPALPDIQGDIGLIERVLTNLIDNALCNTPAGGKVDVSPQATPGAVRLVVRDTGRGIPKEALLFVTRRFYRTEQRRATRPEGTGLELAIVREILELHDSELEIRSIVGVGSENSFALRTCP